MAAVAIRTPSEASVESTEAPSSAYARLTQKIYELIEQRDALRRVHGQLVPNSVLETDFFQSESTQCEEIDAEISLEAEIARLKKENACLRAEIAVLTLKVEKLTESNDTLTKNMTAVMESNATLTKNNDTLMEDVAALMKQNKKREKEASLLTCRQVISTFDLAIRSHIWWGAKHCSGLKVFLLLFDAVLAERTPGGEKKEFKVKECNRETFDGLCALKGSAWDDVVLRVEQIRQNVAENSNMGDLTDAFTEVCSDSIFSHLESAYCFLSQVRTTAFGIVHPSEQMELRGAVKYLREKWSDVPQEMKPSMKTALDAVNGLLKWNIL